MPEIGPHLHEYFRAYLECRITQENGMSVSRVSQMQMESWFNNNAIDHSEREEFATMIMALDDVFMKHRANQDGGSDG